MKLLVTATICASALGAAACDKSTAKDPKTVAKGELNPPTGLISVTHDGAIELRWLGANFEDDFKGYDVFMVADKRASELTGITYPSSTVDLSTDSVPRCSKNSDFFKSYFGFPTSKADCEDSGGSTSESSTGSSSLAETSTDTTSDEEKAPENIQVCFGKGDGHVSLPATSAKNTQTCLIKDLTNGKTYSFFATAVKGDKWNHLSWTSNFVSDTPSTPVLDKQDWKVAPGKFYVIPLAKLLTATKIADSDLVGQTCSDPACKITGTNSTNNLGTTADGVYFGRYGSGDSSGYSQRVLISVPNNGIIDIQPRGPQTMDPENPDKPSTSIPGDEAIDTYGNAGTKYAVNGNQVFDIKITKSASEIYYGKVVIGALTEPAESALSTDDVTVPVTVIMQSKANTRDYFTTPRFDF